AVLSTALCQIGDACAGDHRFSGSTTGVNTNTAQVTALDHHHFPACLHESAWKESAALTGSDYNDIIICYLWHPDALLACTYLITASHLQERCGGADVAHDSTRACASPIRARTSRGHFAQKAPAPVNRFTTTSPAPKVP